MTPRQQKRMGRRIGVDLVALVCSALLHSLAAAWLIARAADEKGAIRATDVIELTVASKPPQPDAVQKGRDRRTGVAPDAATGPGPGQIATKRSRRPEPKSGPGSGARPVIIETGGEAGPPAGHGGPEFPAARHAPLEGPPMPGAGRDAPPGASATAAAPASAGGPFDRRIPIPSKGSAQGERAIPPEESGPSTERDRAQPSPESIRTELGIPEPGSGQIGFDFYSPPDFKEEMAKAEKTVEAERNAHDLRKNWDLGHGVVCNTGSGWFLCNEKTLVDCNRKHRDLCRYAEKKEAATLAEEILF